MGVKSTVELKRDEAEKRLVDLLLEKRRPELEALVKTLPDHKLEARLEMEHDAAAENGEGFENYRIIDAGSERSDKQTSSEVSSLAAKYLAMDDDAVADLMPDWEPRYQLIRDLKTLAASCVSQDETKGQ